MPTSDGDPPSDSALQAPTSPFVSGTSRSTKSIELCRYLEIAPVKSRSAFTSRVFFLWISQPAASRPRFVRQTSDGDLWRGREGVGRRPGASLSK